uniref:Uncharacterized protein n=1 Tax=Rhizophora mucronata TaxID=61149 RepID=A0A2P2PSV5_RHIMU
MGMHSHSCQRLEACSSSIKFKVCNILNLTMSRLS